MRYLYYYERYVLTKLAKTCSTTPGNLVHSSPATLLDDRVPYGTSNGTGTDTST